MKILNYIFIFFLFIGLQSEDTVEVFRVEKQDRIEVHARNSHLYPVTLEVNLELRNLTPDADLPFLTVLNARSSRKLMNLSFDNKAKGWDYRSVYRYYMGSIFARHNDNFAYRMPYKTGEKYLLSQGANGSFSHRGEMKYAFDFNLPEGTGVYAARGGIVVKVEESHNRGGGDISMMDFANFVTILHSDGTFADYSHLQKDGVNVEVGEQVRIGQLIAYSGATGYATGPHLHFAVKKAIKGGGFESISVKFATREGIRELEEGREYLSY